MLVNTDPLVLLEVMFALPCRLNLLDDIAEPLLKRSTFIEPNTFVSQKIRPKPSTLEFDFIFTSPSMLVVPL